MLISENVTVKLYGKCHFWSGNGMEIVRNFILIKLWKYYLIKWLYCLINVNCSKFAHLIMLTVLQVMTSSAYVICWTFRITSEAQITPYCQPLMKMHPPSANSQTQNALVRFMMPVLEMQPAKQSISPKYACSPPKIRFYQEPYPAGTTFPKNFKTLAL